RDYAGVAIFSHETRARGVPEKQRSSERAKALIDARPDKYVSDKPRGYPLLLPSAWKRDLLEKGFQKPIGTCRASWPVAANFGGPLETTQDHSRGQRLGGLLDGVITITCSSSGGRSPEIVLLSSSSKSQGALPPSCNLPTGAWKIARRQLARKRHFTRAEK